VSECVRERAREGGGDLIDMHNMQTNTQKYNIIFDLFDVALV
jgi:hypothetical protein